MGTGGRKGNGELRTELRGAQKRVRELERELREAHAAIEGTPVAGTDVANRTGLSKFRNQTLQRAIEGVQRWFDELEAGEWEQAAFDGASVVQSDLFTLQLQPSLNPEVAEAVDTLRRIVTDPYIAAGFADAAKEGYRLSYFRDSVVAALGANVYRRSNWALFQESVERFDVQDNRGGP